MIFFIVANKIKNQPGLRFEPIDIFFVVLWSCNKAFTKLYLILNSSNQYVTFIILIIFIPIILDQLLYN